MIFEHISIQIGFRMISVRFKYSEDKYRLFEYHFHPEGCIMRDGDREEIVEGVYYIQKAVDDFMTVVKNSNVHIRRLKTGVSNLYYDWYKAKKDLSSILNSTLGKLNHQMNVCFLHFKVGNVLDILPYLRPGTLEGLEFSSNVGAEGMSRIFGMDQWKQATTVFLSGGICYPLEKLTHFRVVSLSNVPWSVELFQKMIQVVSERFQQQNTVFQNAMQLNDKFFYNFSFVRPFHKYGLLQYLSQFPQSSREPDTYYIKVPNSELHLRVFLWSVFLELIDIDADRYNKAITD